MSYDSFYKGQANSCDGVARISRLTLYGALLAQGADALRGQLYRRRANIVHTLSNPMFEALRHDVTMPWFVEVERYQFRLPASPCIINSIPWRPQGQRTRAINMHGLAKAQVSNSPGIDQRGLWRSERASANRRLLGPRQSHRPSRMLRQKASAAQKRCSSIICGA